MKDKEEEPNNSTPGSMDGITHERSKPQGDCSGKNSRTSDKPPVSQPSTSTMTRGVNQKKKDKEDTQRQPLYTDEHLPALPYVTRRGRVIHKPSRYDDYVNQLSVHNVELAEIKYRLLTEHAKPPDMKACTMEAGLNLYSAYTYTIPAHGKTLVRTDVIIALPGNTCGRLTPCAQLAYRLHIGVGHNAISSTYRGLIAVLLFNFGKHDVIIKAGSIVAHLIIDRIYEPYLVQNDDLYTNESKDTTFGLPECQD